MSAPEPFAGPASEPASRSTSGTPGQNASRAEVLWHQGVERDQRQGLRTGAGCVVWFTGLSGSGKSTVAVEVERLLTESGRAAYLLDGDNVRHGLNSDLGFSESDRNENVRRVGEVALLFADAGVVALAPLVSPYRAARQAVRERAAELGVPFVEVYVATPLETCEQRDTKGLYARARAGQVTGLTGVDDPYEEPTDPELTLLADGEAPVVSAQRVLGLVPPLIRG